MYSNFLFFERFLNIKLHEYKNYTKLLSVLQHKRNSTGIKY